MKPSQSDFGDLTIIGKNGDKEKLQKDQWTITGYTNNVNAGTAYAVVNWWFFYLCKPDSKCSIYN